MGWNAVVGVGAVARAVRMVNLLNTLTPRLPHLTEGCASSLPRTAFAQRPAPSTPHPDIGFSEASLAG